MDHGTEQGEIAIPIGYLSSDRVAAASAATFGQLTRKVAVGIALPDDFVCDPSLPEELEYAD